MIWPWTKLAVRMRWLEDQYAQHDIRLSKLESRVAELSRKAPEEPTAASLPGVVRQAIDRAVPPEDESRQAIRVRNQLIRGAKVRLRSGRTDAEVLAWLDTAGDG